MTTSGAVATDAAPSRASHVYKVVDGCAIRADVIGSRGGAAQPCVIWIHGGGLIFGSRTASPRPTLLAALLRRGFVVVSIDHRLAPETKLLDIVEDVHAAWHWVRTQGPALFGIDPERIGIAGGSAGAYLALIGGYTLQPGPRALASFSGYGDITAPWEAEPSAHYREWPPVAREDAERTVGVVPVSEPPADVDRSVFYLYCRQQGRWLIEVTGRDLRDGAKWFDRYCPTRNVTASFPPTILVHGTADTDVPHDESEKLAARFAQVGISHEFLSVDGAGHGLAGARPEDVERAEAAAAAFLEANLR